MRGENDNHGVSGTTVFYPSWRAIFLPSMLIAAGYGLMLGWLAYLGRFDGALARLCMAVLFIGVPLLVVHAVLRALTIRVRLTRHWIVVHRGFPLRDAVELTYGEIAAMRVVRGIGGRVTGSGTLMLDMADGNRIAACDLARPDEARAAIERLVGQTRSSSGKRFKAASAGSIASATGG